MKRCLVCEKPVTDGQQVVRLEQGVLEYRGWGTKFTHLDFEDGDGVKWMHWPCAKAKHEVSTVHLKSEHCILCDNGFEFDSPGNPGECVLKIDRGTTGQIPFEAIHGGFVHFICAVFETWLLPLRYEPNDL